MHSSMRAWNHPQVLIQEGAAIGRYLLGHPPPLAILLRYVEAHAILFPDEPSPAEHSLIVFGRRHRWALPPLDGALALLRPHSLLRNKILLMLALIETTPQFADLFFPEPLTPGGALARMALCGLRGMLHIALGLALYPLARLAR